MQLIGFGSTLLAIAAFAPFTLPVGYLALRGTQLADFDRRSLAERLLWCLAVGTPLSLILSVTLERVISQHASSIVLLTFAAVALFLGGLRLRSIRLELGPWGKWALACMGAIGLYLVLATIPVQSGGRIYESIAAGDWSVRVPLVDMAIHRGEPLVNPFDGIENQTPAIRYYYYWYVLCGLVGHTFHLTARPVITASCAWAAWTLIAVAFLVFKYLFKPRFAPASLRSMCLVSLAVSCILGLDILGIAAYAARSPAEIWPELDWWRSSGDFSMAFHTAALFAPHHTFGLAAMFLSYLLLLPPEQTGLLGTQASSWREKAGRVFVTSCCAASIVGCSSYMAMFLAFSCALLIVDRLSRKDRETPMLMICIGLLAIAISIPFLHEALHTTAHASNSRLFKYPLRLYPRSAGLTRALVDDSARWLNVKFGFALETLIRGVFWIAYLAMEVGFFGYILYLRAKEDWRDRYSLSLVEKAQWALVLGISIPSLFINSDPLAGANDLGRHGGLALRLIAVLWATPLVSRFLLSRSYRSSVVRSGSGKLALAAVLLGLSAQVYQVISQRFFLYASNKNWTYATRFPFPWMHESGLYYYDLYYGYQRLLDPNAPRGRVLYNPTGKMDSAPMLYQTRFSVAPEPNCMTAFGGDFTACQADMPAIQELFGGLNRFPPYYRLVTPYVPSSMTLEAFQSVCRQHGVATVIVSDQDAVWDNRDSFVWKAPVFYATPRVRFVVCPGTVAQGPTL